MCSGKMLLKCAENCENDSGIAKMWAVKCCDSAFLGHSVDHDYLMDICHAAH